MALRRKRKCMDLPNYRADHSEPDVCTAVLRVSALTDRKRGLNHSAHVRFQSRASRNAGSVYATEIKTSHI